MYRTKYYVFLKCNDEKTGDFMEVPENDKEYVMELFADKKQINIEDWKSLYYIKTQNEL